MFFYVRLSVPGMVSWLGYFATQGICLTSRQPNSLVRRALSTALAGKGCRPGGCWAKGKASMHVCVLFVFS